MAHKRTNRSNAGHERHMAMSLMETHVAERLTARQQCPKSNVRFGSNADMCSAKQVVRFAPNATLNATYGNVRLGPIADMTFSVTRSETSVSFPYAAHHR